MAFLKSMKLGFRLEQRLHTVYFEIHLDTVVQTVLHLTERYTFIFLRVKRRSDSGKQMRMIWRYRMFIIQFQGTDKSFFQF